MVSSIVRRAAFALAIVATAGCSVGPAALTSAATPGSDLTASTFVTVKIHDFAYSPKTMTIKAGSTIKWVNDDEVTHTVTASNGTFKSPLIVPHKGWKHTFKTAGTFKYYCEIHPYMHGVVKVTH